ncbi:hypothetical protein SLS64_008563 [Diaporthe eres]|uniref:FAD-binding PCMH-type domain-containing protein n=1 Tax=Diaporthe eres TaxID=83184 RepID=A0ABR1NKQ4_DIAER
MTTLDSLKRALRQIAEDAKLASPKQPLSDAQYSAGLNILKQGAGWLNYEDFIIPHSTRLLGPLFDSRSDVSVLEIGPGPTSLLSYLPRHMRHKVKKYKAFEPNSLFAARLEESLGSESEGRSTLPDLESPPDICRQPFDVEDKKGSDTARTDNTFLDNEEKYDAIIFCHSMYGMKPRNMFIERALKMLRGSPDHQDAAGMILVFHRDNGTLHLEDLVCHQTASFPTGVVCVTDNDEELDSFASFMTGFSLPGRTDACNTIRAEWRKTCRELASRDEDQPGNLFFSSPESMVEFTLCSNRLRELTDVIPLAKSHRTVKNRQALLHHPLPVVQPKEIKDVQFAIRWALECNLSLTVVGGGHSGHCLWPNVVAVDMSAFNQIHIVYGDQYEGNPTFGPVIVAGTGCKTGDIIRKAMAEGLTVPLGSRPSVGAGMWLQGGIGHLARLYGLACDAIVGAVIVSVKDHEQILCVGHVPSRHKPPGSMKPENDAELLQAIKGAGTNFGIVVSVIFQTYAAPTYRARNWVVKLGDSLKAQEKISEFVRLIAKELPQTNSADAYLFWEDGKLRLGVTIFESSTDGSTSSFEEASTMASFLWGPGDDLKVTDGVDLFDAGMYVSRMHGGHGGGKTSSFKRCVFLKHIGEAEVAGQLVAAIDSRPTPLCYLHLLQGGGAVCDVSPDATAFGCRDWDFACVITGVWPGGQDGTEVAQCATQWVYEVAEKLLALSNCRGAYGADLGPDPRDSVLATKAFGPNRRDLAFLKRIMDPQDVLTYACPLPKISLAQEVIILVTGESCAGKDFSADVWVSVLTRRNITHHENLTARVVSISSATKREYAAATGADLGRLLWDRAYKEQHRPDLTAFFKYQERERPDLPKEQFLSVVRGAGDVDVLLITGMRDEAPLAVFSHLVPESRLLEVYVQASDQNRRSRGGRDNSSQSDTTVLPYRPSFTFTNNMSGSEEAEEFAKQHLLPFFHGDLQELASMVSVVPDFPRQGMEFRHVLGIAEESRGLSLCISLLKSHFAGDWATVDSIACCEAGGFVFASPLALQIYRPLLLIREAGKLPPPTVSVAKKPSYVSSVGSDGAREERIELGLDKVPEGPDARVVVVDDVLSKGETLCAVLELLEKAGVRAENVSVMVVAEFPVHRGRELLRQRGFGRTSVQSLLVFGGA